MLQTKSRTPSGGLSAKERYSFGASEMQSQVAGTSAELRKTYLKQLLKSDKEEDRL